MALNDLDGDGLPNDVVYVDTRADRVIVAPVPGTGERYEPFALDPCACLRHRHDGADGLPARRPERGWSMDVLVYYWGRPPIAFLRRDDGARRLTERLVRAARLRRAGAGGSPTPPRWPTSTATAMPT